MIHLKSLIFLMLALQPCIGRGGNKVCLPDWTEGRGGCFLVGETGMKFDEAQEYCQGLGGYLATPETRKRLKFLKKLVRGLDGVSSAWVGATGDDNGDWYWGGSDYDSVDSSFFGSQDSSSAGDCGSLDGEYDWHIKKEDCEDRNESRAFLCESARHDDACYDGVCYQSFMNNGVTFENAINTCELHGGYVAEVTSEDEEARVQKFLLTTYMPNHVWIGATDVGSEGDFYWKSGNGSITADTYSKWHHDEPNNSGADGQAENCVVLDHNHGWGWTDVDCTTLNAVLCEVPE